MSDYIFKYGPFDIHSLVEFKGVPVHVGHQDNTQSPFPDNRIFMWCRLTDGVTNEGKAKIVATGERYIGRYIGTVVMPSSMVWHIVEV